MLLGYAAGFYILSEHLGLHGGVGQLVNDPHVRQGLTKHHRSRTNSYRYKLPGAMHVGQGRTVQGRTDQGCNGSYLQRYLCFAHRSGFAPEQVRTDQNQQAGL